MGSLSIPIQTGYTELDSDETLAKLISLSIGYNRLPCIYNSFISTDVIKKAQASSQDHSLFTSISPDVQSAIIFSLFAKNYILSHHPLSVNGASKYSNGTAQRFKKLKIKEAVSFDHENQSSKKVEILFKFPQGLVVAEIYKALLAVHKIYLELLPDSKINKKVFLLGIAEEYALFEQNAPFLDDSLNELLAYANDPGLEKQIREQVSLSIGTRSKPEIHYTINRRQITFNSRYLGVKTIYGATILSYGILKVIEFAKLAIYPLLRLSITKFLVRNLTAIIKLLLKNLRKIKQHFRS